MLFTNVEEEVRLQNTGGNVVFHQRLVVVDQVALEDVALIFEMQCMSLGQVVMHHHHLFFSGRFLEGNGNYSFFVSTDELIVEV